MAEEYTLVAGPFRPHVRLDDQPVLDEAAVLAVLRSVPQVEELTDEGGELVLDTLVFQFDLVGGSDGRLGGSRARCTTTRTCPSRTCAPPSAS